MADAGHGQRSRGGDALLGRLPRRQVRGVRGRRRSGSPGRGRRWRHDRRAVVAGDRVRELPRAIHGPGRPAAVVAAQVDHRELRAARREVERAAVVDADRPDVPGVDVLERRAAGHPGAQHRGAGAVDADVPEMDGVIGTGPSRGSRRPA